MSIFSVKMEDVKNLRRLMNKKEIDRKMKIDTADSLNQTCLTEWEKLLDLLYRKHHKDFQN